MLRRTVGTVLLLASLGLTSCQAVVGVLSVAGTAPTVAVHDA
ncbi:MAG: hypothetical protein AAGD86_04735 [Pseudomonadota bacterium]